MRTPHIGTGAQMLVLGVVEQRGGVDNGRPEAAALPFLVKNISSQ
jgi:hypothetical protein